MSILSIADRRAVMTAAMTQPDFRDLMRTDPRAAITRAASRSAPDDLRVEVIEEQPDAWEFVVPAHAIDAELPPANDIRSAVENDVYALLRDDPDARAGVVGNPKEFLVDRLQIHVGEDRVNVREEKPGELVLILPHVETREELHDDALDLVAAGGDSGCQSGRMAHKYDNYGEET